MISVSAVSSGGCRTSGSRQPQNRLRNRQAGKHIQPSCGNQAPCPQIAGVGIVQEGAVDLALRKDTFLSLVLGHVSAVESYSEGPFHDHAIEQFSSQVEGAADRATDRRRRIRRGREWRQCRGNQSGDYPLEASCDCFKGVIAKYFSEDSQTIFSITPIKFNLF